MSPIIGLPLVTGQASDVGAYIEAERFKALGSLKENCVVELIEKNIAAQLFDMYKQCNEENWDNEGAIPMSLEVYYAADKLIQNMPYGVPYPEPEPGKDGTICFEWFKNPRKILTLEVNPDGSIYYASLNGNKRQINALALDDKVFPEEIIPIINDIMGDSV